MLTSIAASGGLRVGDTSVCVGVHVCSYPMHMCLYGYACMHVYVYSSGLHMCLCLLGIYVCRCACMYMFMCVCVVFLGAHLIVGYADKCSPVPGPRRVYHDDGYSGAFVLIEGRGRVSGLFIPFFPGHRRVLTFPSLSEKMTQ